MKRIASRTTAEHLVPVLKWRAANQPDRLAYVFAAEGAGDIRLTYAELDRRARSIAVTLQGTASPGDCALLLFPPGLDFLAAFLGCLYAGIVAVPLCAPRRNRDDARLNAIVEDSGARLALTVAEALPERPSRGSRDGGLDFLFTDRIDDTVADRWIEPPIDNVQTAYLQYRSGSTSAPKGVMVTHSNLMSNRAFMQEALELSAQTVSVTCLPHFHDMGLIDGLLNPLHVGYPAVIMAPAEFVARPIRWLQLISRFRATHSGAPNAAYDLCVRNIRPEQRAELDLSSWTMAYCAAEPVRAETLDRFADFFAPCGFRRRSFSAAYGLAEATLMVSATPKSAAPTVKDVDAAQLERGVIVPANGAASRRVVGCGLVPEGIGVSIVDPQTLRMCPDGTVGEIWVSGHTVAAGYWRRPDESSETFEAFIADTHDGPFLRTGDLGFLADKELFVTGRCRSDFPAGHSEALFESLLERDLQNSAEEADGLSRAELLALSPQERGAALEDRLRRHVARVLRMPWQQLDPSEPLGSYGLGSVKAVQMIASIEDRLGVTLPTTSAFNYPTVMELGLHLGRLMGFIVDAGVVEHTEVTVPATHALADEGLIGFLDTVERIPIADMQRMIADKRAGKT